MKSYIAHRVNCDSVPYVKVQHGLWEKGSNAMVDYYGLKVKGASYISSGEFPIIECIGKTLKAPASWEDIKGEVVTDYQDWLEAEWIKTLRAKYPVVLDEEVWNSIRK